MSKGNLAAEQRLLAVLRQICEQLPAAEEYVMVHHPAFRVGKKPFLIAGLRSTERGCAISVNLGAEMQHQLLDDARFTKTPYIGRHGWVTIVHVDVEQAELVALVRESYRRVANAKQLAQLTPESTARPSGGRQRLAERLPGRRPRRRDSE